MAVMKYPVKEMMYQGRFPYFWIRGIQIRLPVPCVRDEAVKKKATLAIAAGSNSGEVPPKSTAVWMSATVGPAARKVHRNMP